MRTYSPGERCTLVRLAKNKLESVPVTVVAPPSGSQKILVYSSRWPYGTGSQSERYVSPYNLSKLFYCVSCRANIPESEITDDHMHRFVSHRTGKWVVCAAKVEPDRRTQPRPNL
jgi:hypothetical protein